MSGKKYLIILGILAAVSFGVSMGLSALLGGKDAHSAKDAAGKPPNKGDALLAGLAADGAGEARKALPEQDKIEQLTKDLRARIVEYERKEHKFVEREKRLVVAEENLVHRAKELETLRLQMVGPLTRLKDAMAELDRARVAVNKQEKANLLRIAATFEKMDPTRGGGILSGMAANEQTDDVAKILFYMSERGSAKMLAEITDKALAAKLTGMMQKIREEG
jgi:hypothetical protein